MPSIEYDRAANITEHFETRLVESISGDAGVDRRSVLGALGVAGSAAIGLAGTRANASAGGDDENEHGTFETVDEYRRTGRARR